MISTKLNLQALPNAIVHKAKTGKLLLIIPLKDDKGREVLHQGTKGTYLDLVHFESENKEFGDTHMVVRSLPKERRDAGERGEILGNTKIKNSSGPQIQEEPSTVKEEETKEIEQLPF